MDTIEFTRLKKIEELLSLLVSIMNHSSDTPKLDIITQKELLKQLNISPNTLKSWENKGLKRLEPPIEGTRTVYYQLSSVINFLNNWKPEAED